jgi:hypothetical protein
MPLIGKPYPNQVWKKGKRELWAMESAGLVGPVPSGGLVEPGRVPILNRACFPNTMGRGQFRNAISEGLFQNTIVVHHSSLVRITTVVPTVNASRHKWGNTRITSGTSRCPSHRPLRFFQNRAADFKFSTDCVCTRYLLGSF